MYDKTEIKLIANEVQSSNKSNKNTARTMVIIIVFVYVGIGVCYTNYKNAKYSKLPIKETIGEIKWIVPSPNFENPSITDKGKQYAKYSFEIMEKFIRKKLILDEVSFSFSKF